MPPPESAIGKYLPKLSKPALWRGFTPGQTRFQDVLQLRAFLSAVLRYISSYPQVDLWQPHSVQYFVDVIEDRQWAEDQLRLYESATLFEAFDKFVAWLNPEGPQAAAREALDRARTTTHDNPRQALADLRAIQSILPDAPEEQLKEVLLYKVPADLSKCCIEFANQFEALHHQPPSFEVLARTLERLSRNLEIQRSHIAPSGSRGRLNALVDGEVIEDAPGATEEVADAYDEQFFAMTGNSRTTYPCLICLSRKGIKEYHRYLGCDNAFCLFCGSGEHPWFRCQHMMALKTKLGIPSKQQQPQQQQPRAQQQQQQQQPRTSQQQQHKRSVN
jgi:hypothetical protein